MGALNEHVDGDGRSLVVSKDPEILVRPDDLAGGDAPAEAAGAAQSLCFAQIGFTSPQGLFHPLAIRDVVVGFEDRHWASAGVPLQGPSARHDHLDTICPGVHEFAFPAAGAQQLRVDLFKRRREDRLHELVRDLADRLIALPSVEFRSAQIPVSDDVIHVAHEDRIVRQVEKSGVLAQHGRSCLVFQGEKRRRSNRQEADEEPYKRITGVECAVLQQIAQHRQRRASQRHEQHSAPLEKVDRQQHNDDVEHRHRIRQEDRGVDYENPDRKQPGNHRKDRETDGCRPRPLFDHANVPFSMPAARQTIQPLRDGGKIDKGKRPMAAVNQLLRALQKKAMAMQTGQ